jgi:dihydrodipicolinate reductase
MIFARGALVAARFLAGQPPGLYGMRDVVGAL